VWRCESGHTPPGVRPEAGYSHLRGCVAIAG
jgi:hypothetical protein